jgi:hypothetical protein
LIIFTPFLFVSHFSIAEAASKKGKKGAKKDQSPGASAGKKGTSKGAGKKGNRS